MKLCEKNTHSKRGINPRRNDAPFMLNLLIEQKSQFSLKINFPKNEIVQNVLKIRIGSIC